MKRLLFFSLTALIGFSSCDKIDDPYPTGIVTDLDTTLYPGAWSDYQANEWPVFAPNGNTLRNILIEDYTGHKCIYCPPAADTADLLHDTYPNRVYVAAIHSGPDGIGSFQSTSAEWPINWTNPDGLAIGTHFGTMPGSAFIGNPRGSVSRIVSGGQHTLSPTNWRSAVVSALPQPLKVNIQSHANYYPSTRGVFLHTEIDVLDAQLTNENIENLYTVVYLIEDSLVAKQKMPDNSTNETYVHRDVMHGCVNSNWNGMKLTEDNLVDGKYYFNYSYALPPQYNHENVHLLIYVRDAVTEEIYHVIKQQLE